MERAAGAFGLGSSRAAKHGLRLARRRWDIHALYLQAQYTSVGTRIQGDERALPGDEDEARILGGAAELL